MAVRSKRLCEPTFVSDAGELLYTVGSGETALVKTVVFVNTGATASTVRLLLNGTGVQHRQVVSASLAVNGTETRDTWLVAMEGDDLYGQVQAAGGGGYVTLHGTELEGVAD